MVEPKVGVIQIDDETWHAYFGGNLVLKTVHVSTHD